MFGFFLVRIPHVQKKHSHCFGFCKKRKFWRHLLKCSSNKEQGVGKQTGIIARLRLLLEERLVLENMHIPSKSAPILGSVNESTSRCERTSGMRRE